MHAGFARPEPVDRASRPRIGHLLHPQGDRVQRWCVAPALGLAALAIAFSALVLLGLWSFWVAILVTVLLQAWGLLTLRRAPSPSVSERDAWFRAQRAQRRMWLGVLIALLALLPVLVADTPQGVDWVGFTALAHHLAERGAFVSASGHSWLYPPGLPAMLAFLAGITACRCRVGLAVGQFTLVALLLGMCSALDRHGAGGEGILAMMLAVGVFSKVLDSGWPTVLSLALIPFNLGGMLEVDGPGSEKRLILLLSAVVSAFLHPVGALLLLLLLVADVAAHGLAKGPLDRFRLTSGSWSASFCCLWAWPCSVRTCVWTRPLPRTVGKVVGRCLRTVVLSSSSRLGPAGAFAVTGNLACW